MDVTKVAKLALQFSEHLPDDHESKEEMVSLATKWIAEHQRNPHTLSAMNDARVIQVYAVDLQQQSKDVSQILMS